MRFLVVNGDPIGHELITGGPDVHVRHANGTEAEHPSVPGEVSVGPNERAVTTFTFDDAGPTNSRAICPATTSTGCTER